MREKTDSYSFAYTERHLQCVWFDSSYRPTDIQSSEGEPIRIINPGRWNLEAGPDFLDAILSIGQPQRIIRGDIEIHIHPGDWNRHNHTNDSRYDGVIAHVTYFPGVNMHTSAKMINIHLKDSLATLKNFSFETIDITSYPFQNILRDERPCAKALKHHNTDYFCQLLCAAGLARLKQKTNRIAEEIQSKGPEQLLYEDFMRALGYKNNRTPFRLLSQKIPIEVLRNESENDSTAAYALLLGTGGLLPEFRAIADKDARIFIRSLWDHWWHMNDKLEKRSISKKAWCLTGMRPHNHPARRLAAAAAIFTRKTSLFDQINDIYQGDPSRFIKNIQAFIKEHATMPFWRNKLSFYGKTQKQDIALIGPQRIAAMITNSFVPFISAGNNTALEELSTALPPEENNSIIRQTANILLGSDHNPAIYSDGLKQQGLVQIFHNFCLDNRNGCENCRLAKTLQEDTENDQ